MCQEDDESNEKIYLKGKKDKIANSPQIKELIFCFRLIYKHNTWRQNTSKGRIFNVLPRILTLINSLDFITMCFLITQGLASEFGGRLLPCTSHPWVSND